MAGSNPTAFISYSWDSEDHKCWVLELAERLVKNGVKISLDRWDVPVGASLTEFMERSVQACDFTLVICTPNYAARSLARRGGVGYEQQIISGQIASGLNRAKFVPIIREGSFEAGSQDCALPPHFLGIHALDFRGDVKDEIFEDLLRTIYGAPRLTSPSLGRMPVFSAETGSAPCRLASLEIEGWHLTSGVVRNEISPDTFHIPSEEERRSVVPGDLVKLTFEFALEDEEMPAGERMWVEITGHTGPYFVGRLRNQPASFVYVNPDDENDFVIDDEAPLTYDSEVIFLPEHIISIVKEADWD